MAKKSIDASLKGLNVFMVGIKGTGMTALAEVLKESGANVSGSDRDEVFYTDSILKRKGIPYFEEFSKNNLKDKTDIVIYSAAYSRQSNPELKIAAERGIPVYSYPAMLGILSVKSDSAGISGMHGKTTTTAIAGTIVKFLNLDATVIAGSEVSSFGNSCSLILGNRFLIAETCEYRRHFLKFHADRIVITNVEEDHMDYYKDIEDIYDAFESYGRSLPFRGEVIFNTDDPGACEVCRRISKRRDDLKFIPYGLSAEGDFKILDVHENPGEISFKLKGMEQVFKIHLPGIHSAGNAAAAVAVVSLIMRKAGREISREAESVIASAVSSFSGSRRRSEIVGEASGVLFMDDYGHHPTEIKKTLAGIRRFYPERKIIADFMPHTYSRTKTFLHDFGKAFDSASLVILHGIYASAREENSGAITGVDLFNEVERYHGSVQYFEEVMDAFDYLKKTLTRGDLFITMGAGDNWRLCRELYKYFKKGRE